jgi:hypothetical protein
MAMARKPKAIDHMTEPQLEAAFPDETACIAYLVARRWPNGVHCPRCAVDGYCFSHFAGTIFENTN